MLVNETFPLFIGEVIQGTDDSFRHHDIKKIIISIAQKNLQQHQVLQTSSPIQGLFVIASVSPSRVLTSVVEKRVRMFDADLTDDNLLKIYKVSCVSLYIALSPSLR